MAFEKLVFLFSTYDQRAVVDLFSYEETNEAFFSKQNYERQNKKWNEKNKKKKKIKNPWRKFHTATKKNTQKQQLEIWPGKKKQHAIRENITS